MMPPVTSQLEKLDLDGGRGGNKSPPPLGEFRRWTFTLNNYTEEEVCNLKNDCKATYMIFGKEVAPTTGTPHLQGYVEWKRKRDWKSIRKNYPRMWCIPSKGNAQENKVYCDKLKKDDFFENGEPMKDHGGKREGSGRTPKEEVTPFRDVLRRMVLEDYKDVVWNWWQEEVLELVEKGDGKRTIHWFWEPEGNAGKTYLCKFIEASMKGIVVVDGKKDNIFNQVNTMINSEEQPLVCLMDIPRTIVDNIHLGTIEALKNGFLYAGKYEGGKCNFPSPVVVCFANQPPQVEELSKDRWNIVNISSNLEYNGDNVQLML